LIATSGDSVFHPAPDHVSYNDAFVHSPVGLSCNLGGQRRSIHLQCLWDELWKHERFERMDVGHTRPGSET